MNKQSEGQIEWTRVITSTGRQLPGFTANLVRGCAHGCRWTMPDGKEAICYAEALAERMQGLYPDGFGVPALNEREFDYIRRRRDPAAIFIDSMSDLLGKDVPDEWVERAVWLFRDKPFIVFQLLTKNAPRLMKWHWTRNVWCGVSSPPDVMFGKRLHRAQQERMLHKSLQVLDSLLVPITWMSFEPLSWDVASIVAQYPKALRWAVIGAASNGRQLFQPTRAHLDHLEDVLDRQGTPVFYKNNLKVSPRRMEFPDYD